MMFCCAKLARNETQPSEAIAKNRPSNRQCHASGMMERQNLAAV
jgi:hypothetical protein